MVGAASFLALAVISDRVFEWAKAQPVTNAILWSDLAMGTAFTSGVFLSFKIAPHSVRSAVQRRKTLICSGCSIPLH